MSSMRKLMRAMTARRLAISSVGADWAWGVASLRLNLGICDHSSRQPMIVGTIISTGPCAPKVHINAPTNSGPRPKPMLPPRKNQLLPVFTWLPLTVRAWVRPSG